MGKSQVLKPIILINKFQDLIVKKEIKVISLYLQIAIVILKLKNKSCSNNNSNFNKTRIQTTSNLLLI